MALRNLVGTDCGQNNPLTQLTSHFLLDQAHEDHGLFHPNPGSGADQLVEEYLEEIYNQKAQTFCMDSLFQEMNKIESGEYIPVSTPGDPSQTHTDNLNAESRNSTWVQEYLGSRKPFPEQSYDEVWRTKSQNQDMCPQPSTSQQALNSIWSPEQFDVDFTNIDIDENWLQDSEGEEERQGSLQELAKRFLNSVDDPKLRGSKFMKFMQQVGNGEVTMNGSEEGDQSKSNDGIGVDESANGRGSAFMPGTSSIPSENLY